MAWDDVKLPPPFLNINTEDDLLIAQDLADLLAPLNMRQTVPTAT